MPKFSFIEKLKREIRGEVGFDEGSRALYAADASNYRQVPIGVVVPKDTEDLIQAIALCRKADVPVLARGAGTSLAGQCCNAAVVLDTSRHLNRILEIDSGRRHARVEPGVILDSLGAALRPHQLIFGPDPATHNRCTIGGMIGNNACGVHSVMAGKTVDHVEELEILTYDGLRMRVGKTSDEEIERIIREGGRRGEIYAGLKALRDRYAGLIRARFPKIPRRVSGYNLDQLLPENGFHIARALVGTEGTCVTILEAVLHVIENPLHRVLVVLGYPDIFQAGDHIKAILGYQPIGLEGLDAHFIRNMKKKGMHRDEIAMMPEGNGWLLVEFGGGSVEEAGERAARLVRDLENEAPAVSAKIFTDPPQQKQIWSVRESTFGASVFVPGEKDTYAGFEDSAVPPERLGDYLRDLQKLLDHYDYDAVIYGHFGDGCIHARISFDLRTDPGIRTYRAFLDEASDLVLRYGGSLSGEHGDGQAWGEYLHKMFGPELVQAFREFKALWDPAGKMNPGKVVDAYKVDENLRLKTYPVMAQPELHFRFSPDGGNFARTTERCIGLGKCLKQDEGVMCPSYMVTREEKHSTRGRAHLLHEMMRGEVITDGWKSAAVKEALDLCLACKACKTECPVNVDVAAYKAEFMSHYYEGRMRPISAYVFGRISGWARAGSYFPTAANFFTQAPGVSSLTKKILGVAPERRLPRLDGETFVRWFRKRRVKNDGRPSVLLWPDTFNNYFYPHVLKSACVVLEAAGFAVTIPARDLCCGRPLYDYGMLGQAKSFLLGILKMLQTSLKDSVPVVVLEPSCAAVFRDELLNLFPDREDAQKLSARIYLFSEFLEKFAAKFPVPRRAGRALVQAHCHHRAVFGMKSEASLLGRLGLDFEILDSGCCGMAGAFGFEKNHYEVSMKAGERVLFPAVRKADPGTLLIADGFSCREQILHATGRLPLHLAELVSPFLRSESLAPLHD